MRSLWVVFGAWSVAACTHTTTIQTSAPDATIRIDGVDVGESPVAYTASTGRTTPVDIEVTAPGMQTVRRLLVPNDPEPTLSVVTGVGGGCMMCGGCVGGLVAALLLLDQEGTATSTAILGPAVASVGVIGLGAWIEWAAFTRAMSLPDTVDIVMTPAEGVVSQAY
jgi:hypothetical protein